MNVEVQPYDPEWPAQFASVAADLRQALAAVPIVGIEHVGSTSVPGLAAKPVLDIDVIVAADHVQAATDALADVGYQPLGEHGVPDRYAFEAPDTLPKRNVYVIVADSLSLRNHLGVRDVLRRNAELRERYGALKLDLAKQSYESTDGYVADKSAVLQLILAEAGLSTSELAAINKLNNS